MAGKIKLMIDEIIEERSKGNPTVANAIYAKLMLKGINYKKYTSTSEDDPAVIKRNSRPWAKINPDRSCH